jgi:para-nitrobenzyl esterase
VLVYIHGGSSLFGDNNEDHQWLVADRNVVAVSVAYRVGVFGYLALDALTQHQREVTGKNVSGNYGILDNIEALKWIRANIKAFGGDPASITIYGQRSAAPVSTPPNHTPLLTCLAHRILGTGVVAVRPLCSTGGTNVMSLFVSPLARGLFDAALSLSGSPVLKGSLSFASQQNADFLTKSGCASTNGSQSAVIDCLYALTPQAAYQAEPDAWKGSTDFGLPSLSHPDAAVIIVDGWVVPLELNAALAGGYGADVPLCYGHMAQEVSGSPEDRKPGLSQAEFAAFLRQDTSNLGWSTNQTQWAIDTYPLSSLNNDSQLAYDTIVNDIVACGGQVNLASLSRAAKTPVFHYINHYQPNVTGAYAAHGFDLNTFLASPNSTADPRQVDTLRAWFVDELATLLTIKSAAWPPFNEVQLTGKGNGTWTFEFLQDNHPGTQTTHNWREEYCQKVLDNGFGDAGWAN